MLQKITLFFKEIFATSIIKTLYFNLHYFGIRGLRIPVLVSKKFKLKKMGGTVLLPDTLEHRIFLGRNDYKRMENYGYWSNAGTVCFLGSSHIGNGTYISVKKDACLTIGDQVFLGGDDIISCDVSITIGSKSTISWNVTIMDDDSHHILDEAGHIINPPAPIFIGEHVWIGFDNHIFKGATIPNHCVVAAGSTITKAFSEEHLLLGNVNQILKTSINWKA